MRGVIVLSEGRSGSEWLTSLATSTGMLGVSSEWFTQIIIGPEAEKLSGPEFIAHVIARASTPNNFFAIKLFPKHLLWFYAKYQIDLLDYFVTTHDTLLVRLTRRDRIRQAISFARAGQTHKWTSLQSKNAPEKYNFSMVCRYYFLIDRSYQYWNSYLNLRGLHSHHVEYEDMLVSPQRYLDLLSAHAGVDSIPITKSRVDMQRDDMTEEWVTQFQADVAKNGIIPFSAPNRPKANIIYRSFRRLIGKPILRVPLGFGY